MEPEPPPPMFFNPNWYGMDIYANQSDIYILFGKYSSQLYSMFGSLDKIITFWPENCITNNVLGK